MLPFSGTVYASKQQHELAVAFFLLGEDLGAAVNVCARQLRDMQLALVLCRLKASLAPDALRNLVRDEILPYACELGDAWLRCISHLLLADPAEALKTLDADDSGVSSAPATACGLEAARLEPSVAIFCKCLLATTRYRCTAHAPGPSVFLSSAYSLASAGSRLLAAETLLLGARKVHDDSFGPTATSAAGAHVLHYLMTRACDHLKGATSMSAADDAAAVNAAVSRLSGDLTVRT